MNWNVPNTYPAAMNPEPATESRPPVNYVFVDGENVPGLDLSFIGQKTVHLTLLLGPKQTKLPVDLVERLVAHAASVHMVRLKSGAKNALDFTLAYYLGRAVQADPKAHFHILSKDKGFEPLLEHVDSRDIQIERHVDLTTLPFGPPPMAGKTSPSPAKPPDESKDLMTAALEHFRKRGDKNPKTRTRLLSDLKAKFGKTTSDKEIESLIERLVKNDHVSINDKGAVTYHLK